MMTIVVMIVEYQVRLTIGLSDANEGNSRASYLVHRLYKQMYWVCSFKDFAKYR